MIATEQHQRDLAHLSELARALLGRDASEKAYCAFLEDVMARRAAFGAQAAGGHACELPPSAGRIRTAIHVAFLRSRADDDTGAALRDYLTPTRCDDLEAAAADLAQAEVLSLPEPPSTARPLPPYPLSATARPARRHLRPGLLAGLVLAFPLLLFGAWRLRPVFLRIWASSSVLHWAAEGGHVTTARCLLALGWDPDMRDQSQRTPLHRAARNGRSRVIEVLLEGGASVKLRDDHRRTPLHEAARSRRRGSLRGARRLLDAGATIDARSAGQTALLLAARNGNAPLAALLIERGADPVAQATAQLLPWQEAQKGGCLELGRKLYRPSLRCGGSHAVFHAGTPLLWAAKNGIRSQVELLLNAGEDLEQIGPDREGTALMHASYGGHAEVVRALLVRGAKIDATGEPGYTPLLAAALGSQANVVRILAFAGAEVSARTTSGATALHFAADGRDIEIVHFLLARGLSPDDRDIRGFTPLTRAVMVGRSAHARALLKAGANPRIRDAEGRTLLHLQSFFDEGLARELVSLGLSLEARDHRGRTPIMAAASSRFKTELLKIFLRLGADANAKDPRGATAMHYAARNDTYAIEHLIAHGASPDLADGKGRTPLHVAAARQHLDCARVLLEGGASPDMRDLEGRTPLGLAMEQGRHPIIDLLANGRKRSRAAAPFGAKKKGAKR